MAASLYLPGTGRGTARRSRVVVGRACTTCLDDGGGDAVQVLENVTGGHSQRREAEPAYGSIATSVFERAIASSMYLAVDLDRETAPEAGEVEAVIAQGMLATKLEPARPCAQDPPE